MSSALSKLNLEPPATPTDPPLFIPLADDALALLCIKVAGLGINGGGVPDLISSNDLRAGNVGAYVDDLVIDETADDVLTCCFAYVDVGGFGNGGGSLLEE